MQAVVNTTVTQKLPEPGLPGARFGSSMDGAVACSPRTEVPA